MEEGRCIVIFQSAKSERADCNEIERHDSVSRRKYFCQSRMQRARDQRGFFRRNREGRREKDVVAAQAVHAALRWIGQHIFLQAGLANFLRDIFGLGKWLALGFVFDELHAKEQAEASHIADVGMRQKRRKSVAQVLPCWSDTIEKFLRFEIIEDGVSGSSANRMSLVREAVHETTRSAFERFDNARGNEHRPQRR